MKDMPCSSSHFPDSEFRRSSGDSPAPLRTKHRVVGACACLLVIGLGWVIMTGGWWVESAEWQALEPKEASELRAKAEKGDVDSQFKLASAYYHGQGLPKSEREAVVWVRKAAEGGYLPAQYNLGLLLCRGEGVPKDDAGALTWFRRAAERGHPLAQLSLGGMYAKGNGARVDEVEAYKWWLLAGAQGVEAALKNIAILERSLSSDQRLEGQRRAREAHLANQTASR